MSALQAKSWQHDELARDLAASLSSEGRMVWTDIQLGPQGSPRPDVFRIDKSFAHPMAMAYECKISRSDFLADVTVGKWRSYLAYAYAVVFAVPDGLVSKSEVPDMCGLIVRKESAWRLAKRPTVNPHPIAEQALLKLLIDGVDREGPGVRRRRHRDATEGEAFAKKFGYEAARYVADATQIHRRLEHVEQQAQIIIDRANQEAARVRTQREQQAPKLWSELLAALSLPAAADQYAVRSAISALAVSNSGGIYKRELATLVASLESVAARSKFVMLEADKVTTE